MSDFQVDLSNCDREPIHIPGQIQSHGFLIVVDQKDIIRFHSDNLKSFIPVTETDLLGMPLEYLESFIGNADQTDLITQLLQLGKSHTNFEKINPFQISISAVVYNLLISVTAEYYLLEFEPAASIVELDVQRMIGRSISEMLADKNLHNLLNNAARQVQHIIRYDRVMVYRFAEDGHGEVVAEAKNEDLEPWLGLHYPASDIPKQARELYKLNLTRQIANVDTIPSKIRSSGTNLPPLDLTHSQLRAVSPIHIQYLKNMGVASSFSISLLYKNELWGLIACHHYSPQFIDYKSRESAKLIGQILSSALEFRQDEENQNIQEGFKNNLDKLFKYLQETSSIEEALTKHPVTFLQVVNATGGILVYEKNRIKLGITPDEQQTDNLISWIENTIDQPFYYTEDLSDVYPDAHPYRDIASGLFISTLSKELKEYVIWFKPEKIRKINWAGKPEKAVTYDSNGLTHISPRHSFEVWAQVVAGKAERWSAQEVQSATRLKEEITYAINLKAGAIRLLNEKLRLAYEELDTFSYTISHDLKNPLAAVKSYTQLLLRDKALGERSQTFLQRIVEKSDLMNLMIKEVLEYSRIGRAEVQNQTVDMGSLIAEIIKDLEQQYDASNLTITVGETPDLQGDPMMILQVFSNLIGNAVKYSQYSTPALVHIEGLVSENNTSYQIKDNGLGIAEKDLTNIFDLFKRMDNVKDIEGSGVGLAIVKRIIDKHHGKIWAKSEIDKGTIFFVLFRNN